LISIVDTTSDKLVSEIKIDSTISRRWRLKIKFPHVCQHYRHDAIGVMTANVYTKGHVVDRDQGSQNTLLRWMSPITAVHGNSQAGKFWRLIQIRESCFQYSDR